MKEVLLLLLLMVIKQGEEKRKVLIFGGILDDQLMPERQIKKKRGPYKRTSDAMFAAGTSNVMRRGYRTEQAAEAGSIQSSTLRSALQRYRLRGTASPLKRGRKPRADFDAQLVHFLLDYVDNHPSTTVKDILDEVAGDPVVQDFQPAKTTLHRWLRANARLTFRWFQSFPPFPPVDEENSVIEEYGNIVDMPSFDVHKNCVFISEAA